MNPIRLLILILAVILLLLESLGVKAPRVQLGWLGLALLAIVFLWVR
jgi:hypothetical protein